VEVADPEVADAEVADAEVTDAKFEVPDPEFVLVEVALLAEEAVCEAATLIDANDT
jgi:hypothetical protein